MPGDIAHVLSRPPEHAMCQSVCGVDPLDKFGERMLQLVQVSIVLSVSDVSSSR